MNGRGSSSSSLIVRDRIDITTLKLLISVAKSHSISAAADENNIAISAASKRLSNLEAALKVKLLERSNRGVELTDIGISVLLRSKLIMKQLELIADEIQDFSAGARGLITVVASESAIADFLPECLELFIRTYPHIDIEFEAKVSKEVLRAIHDGRADIGFFTGDYYAPDLNVLDYSEDSLVLITPRAHPLAQLSSVQTEHILDCHLIKQEHGSVSEVMLDGLAKQRNSIFRGRIRVGSYHAMARMVEAGLGVGIIPQRLAQQMTSTDTTSLVPINESWARRQYKICVRDDDSLSAAARLLLEHLYSHRKVELA